MTNKFQIQKNQLPKGRINPFESLVIRGSDLFVICFLSFGICLKHYSPAQSK
jgi:hypothetical protein